MCESRCVATSTLRIFFVSHRGDLLCLAQRTQRAQRNPICIADESLLMRFALGLTRSARRAQRCQGSLTNRRDGLGKLRLIRDTVDAGGHITTTIYHEDDGVGLDPVLLSQLQSIRSGIIGTYDGQAASELLSQPINDRRCLRSGDSAVGIDKQKRRASQRGWRKHATAHQETGSK